jgi:uncharacterized protein
VDTNVLVSALATRGLCTDLVKDIITKHTPVTSERVIEELLHVLKVKFRVGKEDLADVETWIRRFELAPEAGATAGSRLIGESDRTILSAAAAARVEYFVTGDREVLRFKRIGDMPIGSPRQLWNDLRP